ncbi:MAG TPA: dTDP-4-dehydrorhamnose reductase [Chloroflexota bacterium]|nr:dTDP-4-dehydrorhamnose reductase [Chloroflexota bacterium]
MNIFVTGATGQVGSELIRAFAGHDIISASRPDFDLAAERSVRAAIEQAEPALVLHPAAWTDVDGCEGDPQRAYQVNALGVRYVAQAARSVGAALLLVSTDYVFDGTKGEPYLEWDDPNPLSVYGRSKLAGEQEALAHHDRCYLVRTSWVYSPRGRNFVKTMLRLASERSRLSVVDDEIGGPTLAGDLADAIARLVARGVYGVYHLSNSGSCSRWELARQAIGRAYPAVVVEPISSAAYRARYPLPARRPACTPLANLAGAALGITLPPWEDALARFQAGAVAIP